MRVPLSLLRRFVPVTVDVETLARTLNARVSEVEHIHRFPARAAFAGVRILEAMAPEAGRDEHTRWRMRGTDGETAIVVGDRFGIRPGDRCAAVLGGASLPDGTRVEARAVAGLDSRGVLVSEAMLGIGKDAVRPLRFAPDVALEADPWDALELDDVVLEFDLEPHRPDLYSLLGVARDVGAIWHLPLTAPPIADLSNVPPLTTPALDLRTPRARAYLALGVTGVTVAPSPQWLQNAVRKLGVRSINNVVDAANLAMFEYGQPLHTFDRARLHSDVIALRMAAPGEPITTLDGVERTLTDECLLVCDGERPVAIAGVMGDATSEVHEGTTEVVVESAAFDMAAVRRASRRLSLRTEASLRFEKGLPISSLAPAAARLAHLLAEVAGARITGIARAGESTAPRRIAVDRDYIRGRLGMPIGDAEIDAILGALGLSPEGDVPEFRPDLRIPEDLTEEIGRIHGYEHVVSEPPRMALVSPRANPLVVAAARARRLFTAHGWDEVYLPVWIGDDEVRTWELDPAGLVALINPIAENYRYFRSTALPALLEAVVQNRKELPRFALFEVGRIYARGADGRVRERAHLAGMALGGDLLALRDVLAALGPGELRREAGPHFHPGRSFRLGEWAEAGELHPRLVRAAGLREAPIAFSVDLEAIPAVPAVRCAPAPRFPSIEVDLNVTVGPRVEAAAVLGALPALASLQSVGVVDVYPLPEGRRLTLRLVFNAGDRSMTQEEGLARLGEARAALEAHGWG